MLFDLNHRPQVDEVYKTEGGGLGIRMESTAELDEEGEPHSGSVHHVIQYIHPQVHI